MFKLSAKTNLALLSSICSDPDTLSFLTALALEMMVNALGFLFEFKISNQIYCQKKVMKTENMIFE